MKECQNTAASFKPMLEKSDYICIQVVVNNQLPIGYTTNFQSGTLWKYLPLHVHLIDANIIIQKHVQASSSFILHFAFSMQYQQDMISAVISPQSVP